jgi:hypothetical protein
MSHRACLAPVIQVTAHRRVEIVMPVVCAIKPACRLQIWSVHWVRTARLVLLWHHRVPTAHTAPFPVARTYRIALTATWERTVARLGCPTRQALVWPVTTA